MADDHYDGSKEDHKGKSFTVPPKDPNQIGDDEDKGDKGREAIRLVCLHHGHGLQDIAEAGAQDHTCEKEPS